MLFCYFPALSLHLSESHRDMEAGMAHESGHGHIPSMAYRGPFGVRMAWSPGRSSCSGFCLLSGDRRKLRIRLEHVIS